MSTETDVKTRRLLIWVNEDGKATIGKAILLRHATQGRLGANDPWDDGVALAEICEEWLIRESTRLAGKDIKL